MFHPISFLSYFFKLLSANEILYFLRLFNKTILKFLILLLSYLMLVFQHLTACIYKACMPFTIKGVSMFRFFYFQWRREYRWNTPIWSVWAAQDVDKRTIAPFLNSLHQIWSAIFIVTSINGNIEKLCRLDVYSFHVVFRHPSHILGWILRGAWWHAQRTFPTIAIWDYLIRLVGQETPAKLRLATRWRPALAWWHSALPWSQFRSWLWSIPVSWSVNLWQLQSLMHRFCIKVIHRLSSRLRCGWLSSMLMLLTRRLPWT